MCEAVGGGGEGTHCLAGLLFEWLHEQVQETEQLHDVNVSEGGGGYPVVWGAWPVAEHTCQHLPGVQHHKGLLCPEQLLSRGLPFLQFLLQQLK